MRLIINTSLPKFIKGYPTVSDKYNVKGGIWSGATAGAFGELCAHGSYPGYYKTAVGASAITDIAGFVVATNVKLPSTFPANAISVNAGEAFNLLLDGFIAVELDSGCTTSNITEDAEMCVILATGKVTTSDKASAGTIVQLPNAVFTGVYEDQGTSAAHKYVAEVRVKC